MPDSATTDRSTAAPRALIFDVDGTLIDTWHLYLEAYRRALAPFLDRSPSDEEIIARQPGSERHFLASWVGAEQVDACHERMREEYAALHATHGEGLYEGVHEMLAALRSAGLTLGVVTGKGRVAWEVTDRELALGDFATVVTDDDVEQPKPDPGGLLAAAEALGIAAADAVYVGDSVSDMRAGRAAGMRIAAVLWPKTAPGEREAFLEQIRDLAPEWTFDRPADLTRAFAARGGVG
jgi:phosphoglycolate phosphatase/pyrophosphatase PpaX